MTTYFVRFAFALAALPCLAADPQISANTLKAHVSFLASDALEGRGTPSKGLDIAAEYIAAQFRRAGLEPAGDDGYFQTAKFYQLEPNPDGFRVSLSAAGKTIELKPEEAALQAMAALEYKDAKIAKINPQTPAEQVTGQVVLVRNFAEARAIANLKPALVIQIARQAQRPRSRLVDADLPRSAAAILVIANEEAAALLQGEAEAALTLSSRPPIERPVILRNVTGVLRGSDPQLKDTYAIVSAHYDHIGVSGSGEDRINNGANDDASGTAAVMALAEALSASAEKPKRSILFIAWFGEELGLLGSRYYARHPIVPLAKTVAMLNLEQLGRTDASDGPQVNRASITGFSFSTLPAIVAKAAAPASVAIFKDEQRSDSYFGRSDNQALADLGVPAHTLSVAYQSPDYHRAGDHWDKIDYENMARVTRAVALGVLALASDAPPPTWNPDEPKAARYLEASKKLSGSDQE